MNEQMRRLYEAARAIKGISIPAELARTLNQSSQTLKNWEGRGISKGGMLLAQKVIGCRAEWLEHGTGAMEAGPQTAIAVTKNLDTDLSIPQYETGGRMGNGGLVLQDQPGIIQSWNVSRDWIQANVPNCTSPANLCIVTGFGDSMLGVFNPGDPVLVDRGVTACDHDGLYFFRVGNEGFIKRLQRIPGAGILVISQNPNYRDWTLTDNMDFEVFGKVLKAWKGENY